MSGYSTPSRLSLFRSSLNFMDIFPAMGMGAVDSGLAPPPRRVPMAFRLAELLPFRWWYLWTLLIVAIPPVALWMQQPMAFAAVAVITLASIYAAQLYSARIRLGLLKWGRVADVFESESMQRHNVVQRLPADCARMDRDPPALERPEHQDPDPLHPGRPAGRTRAAGTRIHRRGDPGRRPQSGAGALRDRVLLRPGPRRDRQLGGQASGHAFGWGWPAGRSS